MGDWASDCYLQYIGLTVERRVMNIVKFIDEMDMLLEKCDDWDKIEDLNFKLFIIFIAVQSEMAWKVFQNTQKITILTDTVFWDYSVTV